MADQRIDRVTQLVADATKARNRVGTGEVDRYLDEAEDLCRRPPVLEDWLVRIEIERGRSECQHPETASDAGRPRLERALAAARALDASLLEVLAIRERARLPSVPYDEAIGELVQARRVAQQLRGGAASACDISLPKAEAMVLHSLAVVHARHGQLGRRLSVLEERRQIPDLDSVPFWWLQLARMHAGTLRGLGRFAEHQAVLSEILAMEPQFGRQARACAARVQGDHAVRMSDYANALEHYVDALELTRNTTARGNVANSAAMCAIKLEDFDRAAQLLDRADQRWETHGLARVGTTITMRHRARIAWARGDERQAFELLVRIVDQVAADLDTSRETWALVLELLADRRRRDLGVDALAGIVIERTDPLVALEDEDAVVGLAWSACEPYPDEVPWHRTVIASARLAALGAPSRAVPMEALEATHRWSVERSRWVTASAAAGAAAQLLHRSGDVDAALAWAMRSIEHVERTRSGIGGEFDRMRVARERREIFLLAWELAGVKGDGQTALRVAETARGTALQRLLFQDVGARAGQLLGMDEPEPEADADASPHGDDGGTDSSHADGPESADRRAMGEDLRRDIIEQLRDLSHLLPALAYPDPVEPQELQAQLGTRWSLHLDLDERGRLHMVATSGEACHVGPPVQLSAGQHDLVLALCGNGDETEVTDSLVRARQPRELWEKIDGLTDIFIPGPLRAQLDRARLDGGVIDLLIVPTGVLYGFPFGVLRLDGVPLARFARLVLSPSLRMDGLLHARPPTVGMDAGVLAYAHPELDGGAAELQTLHEVFGDRLVRPSSPDALVQQLRGEVEVMLLSIAAHGIAGSGGLFQYLDLGHGYRLSTGFVLDHLHAAPVTVLGACWLAGMTDLPGADPLGLPVVALVKGASSFIGGLYAIHDRTTAEMLSAFYRDLHSGHDPAEALRRAQFDRYIAGATDVPPPIREWAGLICVGLSGPRT